MKKHSLNNRDRKILTKYVDSLSLMSLATTNGKTLWSATVFYLYDEDLNIYFLSATIPRHCKNISRKNDVSLTIATSSQKHKDKKVGLQISGKANKVTSLKQTKDLILMWNSRFKGGLKIDYKIMIKIWKSRFYKIEPKEIQFYNEKLYKKEDLKIWKM